MYVRQEIDICKETIAAIENYKNNYWAIGATYPTGEPDSFHNFFTERGLPIQAFMQGGDYDIGDASAYDVNIEILQNYMAQIYNQEIEACNTIVNQINEYKNNYWAIGATYPTGEPDSFHNFFIEHSLVIQPFMQGGDYDIGDASAYDINIEILQNYMQNLAG